MSGSDPEGAQAHVPGKPGHFTDLDGMRGVLAVVVMLFHLGLNRLISDATAGYVTGGLWTLCVDFFFILSGFVLSFSLVRARPSFPTYLRKRLWRLAPVYLLSLAVMLLLGASRPFWPVVAANLVMLQPYFGMESLNHPSWSIAYELLLPALALPFLGWLSRPQPAVRWLLAALIGAGAVTGVAMVFGGNVGLQRALIGLTIGALLGHVRQHGAPVAPRPMLVNALFAACLAIMLLTLKFPFLAILFHITAAACIYLGSATRTWFSTRPLQAVGRWSYSIYLLHIPMLAIVTATVGSADGNIGRKLLVVTLTLAGAALMYRFVESRLMVGGLRAPARTAP